MASTSDPQPPTRSSPSHRPRRALGAFAYTFSARGARAAGRILAFLLAARFFSVAQTGQFAVLVSLGTLLGLLADLGLPELLAREIPAARGDSRALERRALLLRLATLLLGAGLGWLGLQLWTGVDQPGALGVLLYAGAVATADLLGALRRARGRNDHEALEVGLPTAGALAGGALAAWIGDFYSFQWVLGGAALALVLLRVGARLRRLGAPGPGGSGPESGGIRILATAASGRWFLLRALAAWAHFELSLLLLRALSNARQVALYAAAMRPVGFLSMPFVVLNQVLLPSLAHDRGRDPTRFRAAVLQLNLVALLMAPAGFAACVGGGELLLHAFGGAYLAARPLLVLLTLGVLVQFALPGAVPLVVLGRERALFWIALGGVALLTLGCLLLVPRLGAEGGALAALVTYAGIKAGHLGLYAAHRLPPLGRKHLAVLLLTLGWLAALGALGHGLPSLGLLAAGGGAAAWAAWQELRRTRLFSGSGPDPAPEEAP